MKINYMKRSMMLLGAAAVVAAASADYRDVTGLYMKNPAFLPGWQGALTATADGVGEVYNGAANLYQVLRDMPAGEYVLTADAFYRCGTNDYAKENMKDGANHFASLYLGTAETTVKGLFDGRDAAPNSTGEAATAFAAGEYKNEVKFTHAGGDLVLGIRNMGGYNDEWLCFDNFQLKSGDTDYTEKIVNANFDQGLDLNKEVNVWNMVNSANSVKTPDVNKNGGVYRKTNASPYNFGQQVTLPEGTYRFSALTFLRHGGAGNYDGKIISVKGQWGFNDVDNSPKQWFEKNLYNATDFVANAYLYVSYEAEKPTDLSTSIELLEEHVVYTSLKDCWQLCEGDYAKMPENETRGTAEGTEIVPEYAVRNVVAGWCDSGSERESAAAFVAEPEKYRQYVEFTIPEGGATVWVGLAKDQNNPSQYWNPFADFKLEVSDGTGAVDGIEAAGNAAPEYYNLQGVRVANPTEGIFIVREGNKVSKKVIR